MGEPETDTKQIDDRRPLIWLKESPFLIVLLLGMSVCVIKAIHAPITHDEAFNFYQFSKQPVFYSLTHFLNVNNHILNTFLSRLSLELFGIGELQFRLPALLGRGVFLVSLYVISKSVFTSFLPRLVCLAALSFCPFLVDFGAASRGYSLGLGFSMLGLAIILPSIVDDTRSFRSVIWASALASLCFGIAIISVPVYLDLFVPIAAVSLLCLGILRKRETNSLRHRLRNVLWLALAWSIPAAALVSAVYVPLLGTIQKDMFYVGEPTWWSAYTRYLIATFQYVCTQDYLTFIPDKWIYAYDAWFFSRLEPIAAVSLLAFFIIVEAALLLRTDKALHFLALLLFFCLAMLFAQHHLMGVLYLVDRAGLFLIVLPLLLWFKALDVLGSVIWQGHQSRMFRLMWNLTLSVVFTVLITLEISKINYEGYRTWWDNSAVRPAMLDLYRECQFGKATDGRVTFGGTWQYRYAFDFYRELYKDDQLSAYHEIRELADGGQPAPSNLDFYLFSADFKNRPPNLELLKTFTASNVSLYVNSASRDLVPEGLNRTVRFGSRFPETAAGQ